VKTPLFVYEPVDLLVFETVDSMRSYLEPIDVEKGVALAFDATGRRLTIDLRGSSTPSKIFGLFNSHSPQPVIHIEASEESDPQQLRQILIEFMSDDGLPESRRESRELLKSLSLEQLAGKALKFAK
jgi:hypothetical protein